MFSLLIEFSTQPNERDSQPNSGRLYMQIKHPDFKESIIYLSDYNKTFSKVMLNKITVAKIVKQ